MCRTPYLSLPIGSIFAFSINARATLEHVCDVELERDLESYEPRLMIGYVRDVCVSTLSSSTSLTDTVPHFLDLTSRSRHRYPSVTALHIYRKRFIDAYHSKGLCCTDTK